MEDDVKILMRQALTATRDLPGRCVIEVDADTLLDVLAYDLLDAAFRAVRYRRVCHLALSGGTTPEAFFRRIVIDPRFRRLPWEDMHVWQVDERCVDADDDRSNFKMIRETLIDHVPIDAERVHAMPATASDGDRAYEAALREALGGRTPGGRLDFVLLGMGTDGHTASLFPHTPALAESERWVVFNDGDTVAPPRPRLTMTFPLLNASRRMAVLATGRAKHAAMIRVAQAPADRAELPVTGLGPTHPNGALTWYLDLSSAVDADEPNY